MKIALLGVAVGWISIRWIDTQITESFDKGFVEGYNMAHEMEARFR